MHHNANRFHTLITRTGNLPLFVHIFLFPFICSVARFRQLQATSESRVSEVQNELKVKMFETERTQMINAETVKNLGQAEMEIEKLQRKVEVRN